MALVRITQGVNDIDSQYAEIMKDWDYNKNNELGLIPNKTYMHTYKPAYWICHKCGHEWLLTIAYRTKYGSRCKECSSGNGTSVPEQFIFNWICKKYKADNRYKLCNTEYDIHIPQLKMLIEYNGPWHTENGHNEFKLNIANKNGYRLVTIIECTNKSFELMENCEDEYIINYYKKTDYSNILVVLHELNKILGLNIEIQSKCNINRIITNKVKFEKYLAYNFPKIAKEYMIGRNKVKPEFVSQYSSKVAWFKCSNCDWEWESYIHNRTKHGCGCPVCAGGGKVVLAGINDLLSYRPIIASEFDELANDITADKVYKISQKKYGWVCGACGGKYTRSIRDRVRFDMACKHCNVVVYDLDTSIEYSIGEVSSKYTIEYVTINGSKMYFKDNKSLLIDLLREAFKSVTWIKDTEFNSYLVRSNGGEIMINGLKYTVKKPAILCEEHAIHKISKLLKYTKVSREIIKVKYKERD